MIQNREFRIAVVEDESGLRNDLVEYLLLRGFATSGFESAEALYRTWPGNTFDLAILDIRLPGASGLQAAQWLRARSTAGIVILTALGEQSDMVVGLEAGADAYLVKNTSLEVIDATCRSVLRRLSLPQPETAFSGAPCWRLSPQAWQLTLPDGKKVELTHTETMFLQSLLRYPGTPVCRTKMLAVLGKTDTLSNLRNLDNCASRLRRKILKECNVDIPIRPSYGQGYTFTGDGRIDSA